MKIKFGQIYATKAADGKRQVMFHLEPDVNDGVLTEVARLLKSPDGEQIEMTESPTTGSVVALVAEVQAEVLPVVGGATFEVKRKTEKVGGGKPDKEPGKWSIQSVIFDKDKFSLEHAKTWVKDHDGYEDHGHDEKDKTYRFRQFDPGAFDSDSFRTISITDGVSAVYGKVAAKDAEAKKAEQAVEKSITDHAEVMETNRAILKKGGVRLFDMEKVDKPIEERFILGLVLEPNDGTDAPLKPDTQAEVYSAEAIRKSAHNWMENHGSIDLGHSFEALGKDAVRVLECYIAPCAFTIGEGDGAYEVRKGSWLLGVRVRNDEIWQAIKKGELGAFSVGGLKKPVPFEGAPAAASGGK
jgi:hypothetical protein